MHEWPKRPHMWLDGRTLMVSVPFTWDLPDLKGYLLQRHAHWDRAVVGGPAVQLMPDYLKGLPNVRVDTGDLPGVLQRVNPFATRTTTGCVRRCGFCGIGQGRIEARGFMELHDWPDLPLVCDNNLLAASIEHFDRVMDRLERHVGVDFNQGMDARLLDDHHAKRLSRLRKPAIRLALDHIGTADVWSAAYERLLRNGCKKSWISSYALIGFNSDPSEGWERCEFIQKHCNCLPMWFHELDALARNGVTDRQKALGWSEKERLRIMRRFYKAKYGGYTEAA